MLRIVAQFEGHEVAEIHTARFLKVGEDRFRRADQPQVDVFGGAGARQPQFQHKPALEHRRVSEHSRYSRQKSVEDQQLPAACEVETIRRCGLQTLLQRLLEGERRGV